MGHTLGRFQETPLSSRSVTTQQCSLGNSFICFLRRKQKSQVRRSLTCPYKPKSGCAVEQNGHQSQSTCWQSSLSPGFPLESAVSREATLWMELWL